MKSWPGTTKEDGDKMTTFSHKGSILPIRNRVLSVDEHTTFLAHYDLNANDVLKGITPTGYSTALEFDGSIQGVIVSRSNALDCTTNSVTIEAWVYPTQNPSGDRAIVVIYKGAYYLTIDSTLHVATYWYGRNPEGYHVSNGTIPLNQWTHIAAAWSPTEVRIYINGTLDKTVSSTGTGSPGNELEIGGENNSRRFYGKYSDIRVWNVARTEAQIKAAMHTCRSDERGLVGWWKLDDGEGSIVRDSSPFHHDGVFRNNPKWVTGRSIFTLRPKEGKFGGGIAIEERTENLLATVGGGAVQDWTKWSHWNSSAYWGLTEQYDDPIWGKVFKGTFNGAVRSYTYIFDYYPYSYAIGDVYTFSCWMKVNKTMTKPITFYLVSDVGRQHIIASNSKTINFVEGQWQYVTFTSSPVTEDVPSGYGGFGLYMGSGWNDCIVEIAYPQFEKKSFATSFVNGVRDSGILEYPTLGILNPNAGTINVWVNVRDDLPNHDWRMIFVTKDKGRLDGTETNQIRMGFVSNWYTWHWKMAGSGGWSFYQTLAVTKGWHMFAITWDKTTGIKYYYDGELKYSTTDKTCIPSQFYHTFWLGTWLGEDFRSNHIIDELRIDKIARTDEEIAAWYYSNSPFWPRGIYRKA